MLGIHKGDFAAALLCLRQNVQGKRRLTGGFRTVDLDDTAAGQAADAEGGVQRKGAGGDGIHVHLRTVAQTHDGALAIVFLDLVQRGLQRFFLVVCGRGGLVGGLFLCHGQPSSLFRASTARVMSAVSFFSSAIS